MNQLPSFACRWWVKINSIKLYSLLSNRKSGGKVYLAFANMEILCYRCKLLLCFYIYRVTRTEWHTLNIVSRTVYWCWWALRWRGALGLSLLSRSPSAHADRRCPRRCQPSCPPAASSCGPRRKPLPHLQNE